MAMAMSYNIVFWLMISVGLEKIDRWGFVRTGKEPQL